MNTINSQTPNLAWLYAWIHNAAEELRAKKKNAVKSGELNGSHTPAANSSDAHKYSNTKRRKTKGLIKAIS
jgi:hypothetical protein